MGRKGSVFSVNSFARALLVAVLLCLVALATVFLVALHHTDRQHGDEDTGAPPPSQKSSAVSTVDPQAIVTVWDRKNAADVHARSLATGGVMQYSWSKFAGELSGVDATACPADFQAAWANYVQAVAAYAAKADTATVLPAGIETHRAKGIALEDFSTANERVQSSLLEAERVARQHGVHFQ